MIRQQRKAGPTTRIDQSRANASSLVTPEHFQQHLNRRKYSASTSIAHRMGIELADDYPRYRSGLLYMPCKSPNTTRSDPPSWRSRGSELQTLQPDKSEAGALPGSIAV